jgi:predicted O-methyltransferase YrrM
MNDGYLHEKGWLNSVSSGKTVDKNNEPIPWMNYPVLDYLEQALPGNARIFEFGSGYSTAWFCKKYGSVISVDNDPGWHNKTNALTSSFANCKLILEENEADYINTIDRQDQPFDLIVIDGVWRSECLLRSIDHLAPGGIILLDDSDREEYQAAYRKLTGNGFTAIPFTGMKAASYEKYTATIFMRK